MDSDTRFPDDVVITLSIWIVCRTLYDEGKATIPKLAEKLTLELVNHIEVAFPCIFFFIHSQYSSVGILVAIVTSLILF